MPQLKIDCQNASRRTVIDPERSCSVSLWLLAGGSPFEFAFNPRRQTEHGFDFSASSYATTTTVAHGQKLIHVAGQILHGRFGQTAFFEQISALLISDLIAGSGLGGQAVRQLINWMRASRPINPGGSAHPFRMLGRSVKLRSGLERLKLPTHRGFLCFRNNCLHLRLRHWPEGPHRLESLIQPLH